MESDAAALGGMDSVLVKGRIFVIEDDELIGSMLTRMLMTEGYEVKTETWAFQSVVDRIQAWSPDVVLLDMSLPEGASATDILEEVKARRMKTQVIMLACDGTREMNTKCMKLGAAAFLTKPVDEEEVRLVISSVMEKESLRHEVNYLRRVMHAFIDGHKSPGIEEGRRE